MVGHELNYCRCLLCDRLHIARMPFSTKKINLIYIFENFVKKY